MHTFLLSNKIKMEKNKAFCWIRPSPTQQPFNRQKLQQENSKLDFLQFYKHTKKKHTNAITHNFPFFLTRTATPHKIVYSSKTREINQYLALYATEMHPVFQVTTNLLQAGNSFPKFCVWFGQAETDYNRLSGNTTHQMASLKTLYSSFKANVYLWLFIQVEQAI